MTLPPPRSIFISGASSGIGAALAMRYAARGVTLFLHGRNRERLEDLVRATRIRGADVYLSVCDVTDAAAMAREIARCDDLMPLDLVIANAGISGGTGGGEIGAEPGGQAREIFAVNVDGALNTTEPALARMIPRGRGQVALMSSLASFSGWPGAPAYSASKAAVRIYGEALRARLAPKGIAVSVICPGFIRTPMTAVNPYKMPFLMEPDEAADIIARGLARGRGRVAFPWQTYFFARALGLLPFWLTARLLAEMPEKPARSAAPAPGDS
jgi:short-subunit dehydrogenase